MNPFNSILKTLGELTISNSSSKEIPQATLETAASCLPETGGSVVHTRQVTLCLHVDQRPVSSTATIWNVPTIPSLPG